ncbi:MAG TPA: DUF4936 family protein [Burkholderiales bacterium]|nr:DUF4936 family protein [Burkholderiales bacterium]
MPSYYIYYRVADAAAAAPLVARLQRTLRDQAGVAGRLLKKRGEPALWMEIYDDVPDAAAFERLLARTVDDLRFARVLADGGGRRIECFEAA